MSDNKRIAVILAAHGEAETSRFAENYRVSRRTLEHAAAVMGVPPVLQIGISLFSALKKKLNPRRKGSPHNRISREQARELQNYLGERSGNGRIVFDVHAAFSASDPSLEEVIEKTKHHDAQILVSMSPVDNDLTCGQLCRYLARTRPADDLSRVKVISRFWCDATLHQLCAAHVVAASAEPRLGRSERHVLLLLFHGTLVTDGSGELPAFRTGLDETMAFAASLTELLGSDVRHPYGRIMTAFLNHDVGGEWTRPSFEETAALLRCFECRSLCCRVFCGWQRNGLSGAGITEHAAGLYDHHHSMPECVTRICRVSERKGCRSSIADHAHSVSVD